MLLIVRIFSWFLQLLVILSAIAATLILTIEGGFSVLQLLIVSAVALCFLLLIGLIPRAYIFLGKVQKLVEDSEQ